MKDPNCTPCQEWELCPFHPADEPPETERLPPVRLVSGWDHVRDPLSAEAQAVLNGLKQAARSRPDIRQALVKAGHCAADLEREGLINPSFLDVKAKVRL